MSCIPEVLRDVGFWLRAFAFLVNISITILWAVFKELPAVCSEQVKVFLHVVPGFNVILFSMTVAFFFERLKPFTHRVLSMTGACLFALAGIIGVINFLAFGDLQTSSLFIALLCLTNGLLLTADLIVLESTYPLERRDPPNDDNEPRDSEPSKLKISSKDSDYFITEEVSK